jgi:hypothetical protein
MFECIDECLVDALCFIVSLRLLPRLLFEAVSLVERIVQLGVRIALDRFSADSRCGK